MQNHTPLIKCLAASDLGTESFFLLALTAGVPSVPAAVSIDNAVPKGQTALTASIHDLEPPS